MELTGHNGFYATSLEENDFTWLCNVFIAVAVAALKILLIAPGIQLRPAVYSRLFMRYGQRVVLTAGYLSDMQIVLLEEHELHRQVLVALLPLLLTKARLAVKRATPDKDSTIAGQSHRVEEGAGDLGYVKV